MDGSVGEAIVDEVAVPLGKMKRNFVDVVVTGWGLPATSDRLSEHPALPFGWTLPGRAPLRPLSLDTAVDGGI